MIGNPAIQFGTVRIGKRYRRTLGDNTVPDRFNQGQTVLHTEAIDSKRFQRERHGTCFLFPKPS